MLGLPYDAARDAPPRIGRRGRRRPPGWWRRPRPAGRRVRRQRAASRGTRRRGCEPGTSRTSIRKPQQAPSRSAGRAPPADLGLELPGAEQTVATSQPRPARGPHGTTKVRGAGPTLHDPARSRGATGAEPTGAEPTGDEPFHNPGRRGRCVEYEQGRTALPCASSQPPSVGGSHGGVRSETHEIDGLDQCRDDALPAAFRARVRDEDETAEIGPQLGSCC